jgi:hypothetical protein
VFREGRTKAVGKVVGLVSTKEERYPGLVLSERKVDKGVQQTASVAARLTAADRAEQAYQARLMAAARP